MMDRRGWCEVWKNHRLRMLNRLMNYSLRMLHRFMNVVVEFWLLDTYWHFLRLWMNLMMDKTNWT